MLVDLSGPNRRCNKVIFRPRSIRAHPTGIGGDEVVVIGADGTPDFRLGNSGLNRNCWMGRMSEVQVEGAATGSRTTTPLELILAVNS